MKDLILTIAVALVDNPNDVHVHETIGENTSIFELRVAKGDMGKVIGKQGRTALAMRTLLGAVSTKLRKRAILEIVE